MNIEPFNDRNTFDRPVAPLPALQPMHKRALGTAVGAVCGILVVMITSMVIIRQNAHATEHLALLSQYFAGYSVTWGGAVIGAAWGAFSGFILGWFLAFVRNFTLGVMLIIVRSRAEYEQGKDFLDHI